LVKKLAASQRKIVKRAKKTVAAENGPDIRGHSHVGAE
jgi:hypothetical protein